MSLAGIVGISASDRVEWAEAALTKIEHRGGAGRSVRSSADGTLGEVWPSAQDAWHAGLDEQRLALDGEIYNWTDLAARSANPLAALSSAYEEKGPEFVGDLDGPFAVAIAGPQGLFLARDPLGRAPLYYGHCDRELYFASELKALLEQEGDISEFPPGHYYEPGEGLVRYGKIEKRPSLDLPEDKVAEELRGHLASSVAKRSCNGEVGAWLSGGIDSATMAALARCQLPRLQTFVAGVEGAPDLEYARAVAEFVGTEHHECTCSLREMLAILPDVIYHLESFDALLVRSSVTNFLVGRLASEHVAAVLSGEGGDELFAGYAYLKDLEMEEIPDELVDITRRLHNTALQRVDRCSASHGLVARTGFLDQEVVDYALRIPPEMKLRGEEDQVEKWILRRAMDGMLPRAVLTRTKAKFWEGAGVKGLLAAHAEETISDAEFAAERSLGGGITLNSKEELLYYRIFRDLFGADLDPALVGRTKGAPKAN
jgi:asparagine synthase (glutamine-hydrolysing)